MRFKWQQFLVFLRLLTLRKLVHGLLARLSYRIASVLKIPVVWGAPPSLSIEPTNHCNLDCPECPAAVSKSFRKRGFLSLEQYKKLIRANAARTWYLMLYFQGEPLLHPKITDMIRYAVARRIYTVTSTNGQFINEPTARALVESGLHELIISMDGYTQESYEKYRKGGQLHKVKAGIEFLNKYKSLYRSKYPLLHLQFLVFRHNEHEMSQIRNYARIHADGFSFKSPQFYSAESQKHMMSSYQAFNRYEMQQGNSRIRRKLKNHCKRLWTAPVITYDGHLLPCCFDKYAQHTMGNVFEVPLKQLWRNPVFQSFRSRVLKQRDQIAMCSNCSEGVKVRWKKSPVT